VGQELEITFDSQPEAGLHLVATLSDRLGVEAGSSRVWFELRDLSSQRVARVLVPFIEGTLPARR
jgi:hypothetical protein